MDTLGKTINGIILRPQYTEYLALIKAARNGAVYGAKVRFPHALVMVFLFRSGSLKEKLNIIFKATRTHARNLATFAVIYKTTVLLLRHASPSGREASHDTFLAGLLGGYIVFGRNSRSSVNQQIVTYVFARVVLALAKMCVQKGGLVPAELRKQVTGNAWPMFAASGILWNCMMVLSMAIYRGRASMREVVNHNQIYYTRDLAIRIRTSENSTANRSVLDSEGYSYINFQVIPYIMLLCIAYVNIMVMVEMDS